MSELEEAKADYLKIVYEETATSDGRPRREAHRRLCSLLGFPLDQFKPFDDLPIAYDKSYYQLKEMLEQSIVQFKWRKEEEPHLHCGCCGIPFNTGREWQEHSKTPEHALNAIKAIKKMMDDPHLQARNKEDISKMRRGKPVELSMFSILYDLQLSFEKQLQK